jgi:hypothetical protein
MERRRKSGAEEYVDSTLSHCGGQGELLPQNSRHAILSADGLGQVTEPRPFLNQVVPRLPVGEDEVLVLFIQIGERG